MFTCTTMSLVAFVIGVVNHYTVYIQTLKEIDKHSSENPSIVGIVDISDVL